MTILAEAAVYTIIVVVLVGLVAVIMIDDRRIKRRVRNERR